MQLARAKEASNKLEEDNNCERLRLKQAQLEGGQLRSQVIEVCSVCRRMLLTSIAPGLCHRSCRAAVHCACCCSCTSDHPCASRPVMRPATWHRGHRRIASAGTGVTVGCLQSPEKLQRQLEELRAAVDKERALTTEAERRMRTVQARLEAIARVLPPISHPAMLAACMSSGKAAAMAGQARQAHVRSSQDREPAASADVRI